MHSSFPARAVAGRREFDHVQQRGNVHLQVFDFGGHKISGPPSAKAAVAKQARAITAIIARRNNRTRVLVDIRTSTERTE